MEDNHHNDMMDMTTTTTTTAPQDEMEMAMNNHTDETAMVTDDAMVDAMMNETMSDSNNGTMSDMDHGDMDHGDMNHGDMNHGDMDHGDMNHGAIEDDDEDHSNHDHSSHNTVTDASSAIPNSFCVGGEGMVMYMEGFQWGLKGESTCLNLYFESWTLNTPGRFVGAMFGVIALAVLTEAISKLRHELSRKVRHQQAVFMTMTSSRNNNSQNCHDGVGTSSTDTNNYAAAAALSRKQLQRLSWAQLGLHGIHALTGYILMLAAMTFSLEFLLCIVVGLMIGYVVFGGDGYSHVSTNPCCAFLEEDDNDSRNGSNSNTVAILNEDTTTSHHPTTSGPHQEDNGMEDGQARAPSCCQSSTASNEVVA